MERNADRPGGPGAALGRQVRSAAISDASGRPAGYSNPERVDLVQRFGGYPLKIRLEFNCAPTLGGSPQYMELRTGHPEENYYNLETICAIGGVLGQC